MIHVAINGFGRIGRTVFKAGWNRKGIQFVGINDLTQPEVLAHLLQYDSVHGRWNHDVSVKKGQLVVDGIAIPIFTQKDPSQLPWKQQKVDVVIECTGLFRSRESASAHLQAGAKRVVISAPAKDVPGYLMGVNHKICSPKDVIVHNASCTTNSVAPIACILQETFGIQKAMLTTIHSVTAEQNLVDGLPPREKSDDLRRARSGMVNLIPTTTGAAQATTEILPELEGKFDGIAIRVPTLDVSLTDFTFLLKKRTTEKELNDLFKKSAKIPKWKGILGVTDQPLVSSDFIGSPFSCVVDLSLTKVVDGYLVKILAWYDNEWGYSLRLMDLVMHVGRR